MMTKLSIKEQRFIEAKAQGLNDQQATKYALPHLKPSSVGKTANRLSKNVKVLNALEQALENHQINMDSIIKPIAEALRATKLELIDGSYHDSGLPDHSIRVNSAKTLYGITKDLKPSEQPTTRKILEINTDMSDQELAQALFKPKDV